MDARREEICQSSKKTALARPRDPRHTGAQAAARDLSAGSQLTRTKAQRIAEMQRAAAMWSAGWRYLAIGAELLDDASNFAGQKGFLDDRTAALGDELT